MENDKMYISIHDIELIGDILDELAKLGYHCSSGKMIVDIIEHHHLCLYNINYPGGSYEVFKKLVSDGYFSERAIQIASDVYDHRMIEDAEKNNLTYDPQTMYATFPPEFDGYKE